MTEYHTPSFLDPRYIQDHGVVVTPEDRGIIAIHFPEDGAFYLQLGSVIPSVGTEDGDEDDMIVTLWIEAPTTIGYGSHVFDSVDAMPDRTKALRILLTNADNCLIHVEVNGLDISETEIEDELIEVLKRDWENSLNIACSALSAEMDSEEDLPVPISYYMAAYDALTDKDAWTI